MLPHEATSPCVLDSKDRLRGRAFLSFLFSAESMSEQRDAHDMYGRIYLLYLKINI